jgi:hypothetical protein
MSNLRKLLMDAAARADYSRPLFQEQMARIDMVALESKIEIMAKRAVILSHAFDVMQDGREPHPMPAFMHAVECQGPVDDYEFATLLSLWGRLCNGDPTVNVG